MKSSIAATFSVYVYNTNGRIIGGTYTINSADTWEYKSITFAGDTGSGGTIDDDNTSAFHVAWALAVGSNYASTDNTSWADYSTGNLAFGHTGNAVITTTNATWEITGVQFEVGSVATEFEHQKYCDVYKDCQRYYYKSGDNAASGNEWFPGVATNANRGYYYALALESVIDRAYPALQWPVQMRAAPSVTFYPGRNGVTNTADRITLYNADTLVTFTQSPFPYSNGITDIFWERVPIHPLTHIKLLQMRSCNYGRYYEYYICKISSP